VQLEAAAGSPSQASHPVVRRRRRDAPNQQPAGCTTGTLTFAYAYDVRGLVSQRDVVTDAGTTRTTYAHDALGRLTRSVASGAVTGRDITVYAWDAASNLVGEGGDG
jgi:YD repeat-containing protein